MVILGVGIMLGVSAWNGMMIYVTTQATRRDIARTVRTVVIADMHEAMESTRRELQLLNMATIQRLVLLRFDDAALRQWVDTAVARVLAAHPQIVDIALYNTDNRKIRQARQSANLPEQLGGDQFCLERDMLAYRVSVTALTIESVPRGALSAIILLPPTWFRRYEDSLDMQVIVTPERQQTPHLHLMSKRIQEINPLATLRWAGSRLWLVYQIDVGEHSALMTVMFFYDATHLFWGMMQAISVTVFMGVSFAGISTFFDADYRRVSTIYQTMFHAVNDWILYQDRPYAVRVVNAVCASELFHATPEVIQQAANVIIPDATMATAIRATWRTKQRQTFDSDFQGRRLAGVTTPILRKGRVCGVVTVMRDFSDLFHAQQYVTTWRMSAMTAQAVLQAIFDALPEWICVVDDRGNILMQGETMKIALRKLTVDMREVMDEPASQFVWTQPEGSSWLVTKVRLPLDPPQWVILARNITDMAAQQELLDQIITLTTVHLRELTKRRKSALITINGKNDT